MTVRIRATGNADAARGATQASASTAGGVHTMPPFPAFEVSSSYETYAEEGLVRHDAERMPSRRAHDDWQEHSFETQVDSVLTCVGSQNALREVLYKALVFCQTACTLHDAEAFIASQDEFVHSHIMQTPYTMLQMLVRAGGLQQRPLDKDGNEVTQERTEGLSEDEIDDLVESYEVVTTAPGRQAADLLSPERRFAAQLAQKPHRAATFYALLDFCSVPRSLPEIQEFFKTTPHVALDQVQVHHTLSPDFYVDKLDKAGVLVWQGAWVATEKGKELLARYDGQLLSR